MAPSEKVMSSTSVPRSAPGRFVDIFKKAKSVAFSGKNGIKYILGALILLNILDALVTNTLINHNIAREGNLVLMGVAGGPRLIVVKFLGVLLAAVILWDIHRRHPRTALGTGIAFSLIYIGIVGWNLGLLLMG